MTSFRGLSRQGARAHPSQLPLRDFKTKAYLGKQNKTSGHGFAFQNRFVYYESTGGWMFGNCRSVMLCINYVLHGFIWLQQYRFIVDVKKCQHGYDFYI